VPQFPPPTRTLCSSPPAPGNPGPLGIRNPSGMDPFQSSARLPDPKSCSAPAHCSPSSGPKPLLLLSRDSQSELSRLAQRSSPSSRAADPQAERGCRSGVGVRDEDEEEDDEKRSQRPGMVRSEARTLVDELGVRKGRSRCKTRGTGIKRQSGEPDKTREPLGPLRPTPPPRRGQHTEGALTS
jgi:hypothetical protein